MTVLLLDDIKSYTKFSAVMAQLTQMGEALVILHPSDITAQVSREDLVSYRADRSNPSEGLARILDGKLYQATDTALAIAAAAQPDQYGLVVIGHNMGAGFALAEALCAELRSAAVVVSYSPLDLSEQDSYIALGYGRFALRSALDRELMPA